MTTKVYVIDFGRKFFYLQWTDPQSGRKVTRSSRCTRRRDAERKAADLENQLSSSGILADGKTPWVTFIDRYQCQHLASLAERSEDKALGVLDVYERLMSPRVIGDVTAQSLAEYASRLRQERTESTIVSHLGALQSALKWAASQSMIFAVPMMPRIARSVSGRRMKGRPLTSLEFCRMLRATRAVTSRPRSRSWRRLLRGLWLSGLRLKESLALSWDDPQRMRIDWSGRFPMFVIHAEGEKGFRDRLLPLTPDFAAYILRTPVERRTGSVFSPIGERGRPVWGDDYVGRVISAIGKEAGVVVDLRSEKYASAHDLRRTFGSRWARRVAPKILMDLMRHSDISTTMKFYVELDAEQTAKDLWEGFANS